MKVLRIDCLQVNPGALFFLTFWRLVLVRPEKTPPSQRIPPCLLRRVGTPRGCSASRPVFCYYICRRRTCWIAVFLAWATWASQAWTERATASASSWPWACRQRNCRSRLLKRVMPVLNKRRPWSWSRKPRNFKPKRLGWMCVLFSCSRKRKEASLSARAARAGHAQLFLEKMIDPIQSTLAKNWLVKLPKAGRAAGTPLAKGGPPGTWPGGSLPPLRRGGRGG